MIILWPIAGKGIRFKKEYKELKPFIEVKGKTLIEYSISSLNIPGSHFVIANKLKQQYKELLFNIRDKYELNMEIIELNSETKGQAETSLLGLKRSGFNDKEELIVANSDQFTPWNSENFIETTKTKNLSGLVTTYQHQKFKIGDSSPYSHVKLDNNGRALEFSEKIAISQKSLNGIFYWKNADLFYYSAHKLIHSDTIGEKWISLTFNYLIEDGHQIKTFEMKKNEFYSLGTPEDLVKNKNFLR